jgi:hypothetical protein
VDGALDVAGNGRCSQLNATSARQLGQTEVVERGARAVDGSGTCRRKAQLDGRYTSDSVSVAARNKQPQVQLGLSGLACFLSMAQRPAHRAGQGTRQAHLRFLAAAVNEGEDGEVGWRWFGSKQGFNTVRLPSAASPTLRRTPAPSDGFVFTVPAAPRNGDCILGAASWRSTSNSTHGRTSGFTVRLQLLGVLPCAATLAPASRCRGRPWQQRHSGPPGSRCWCPCAVAPASWVGDDPGSLFLFFFPHSCASLLLLHEWQPGGSWTRPPVLAAKGGSGTRPRLLCMAPAGAAPSSPILSPPLSHPPQAAAVDRKKIPEAAADWRARMGAWMGIL